MVQSGKGDGEYIDKYFIFDKIFEIFKVIWGDSLGVF